MLKAEITNGEVWRVLLWGVSGVTSVRSGVESPSRDMVTAAGNGADPAEVY